jgi:hypothetical protein
MRKLYYAPGIISLIGFIFLLPYAYKRIVPPKQNYLRINFPKDDPSNSASVFSEQYILKFIHRKNKITFTLDQDKETNAKKLEMIRYEARKLKYTFDSTAVVLVQFTDDVAYGEFIRLLDQCKVDSIRRYALCKNTFVIIGDPVPEKNQSSTIIPYFGSDVVKYSPQKTFEEKLIEVVKPYISFQSISLFISWLILATTHLLFHQKKQWVSHSSSTL